MEGRPKRANPNSFHKLCRPYVLIAIQHPSNEDGCGIYSQPALLICHGAIPLLFVSTARFVRRRLPDVGLIHAAFNSSSQTQRRDLVWLRELC